ncbi:MAG: hypothetical protein QOG23_2258 [Blastocatellia bacterium]|nr:hypothetical protein [Blastocatellia bacterium]
MVEPSLTVGLVPRIANRLVATHCYPSTLTVGLMPRSTAGGKISSHANQINLICL